MIKIFNRKFKNPLKKDQEIAIVSNSKIKDEIRLAQAKQLLENQQKNPSSDEDYADSEDEFERDEDLSSNETIDPIKLNKRRLDSLQQIYAELDKQDKEQSLKLKILKKKETIQRKKDKYQEMMEIQAEQDKYYELPKNSEGYYELKEEKWNEEYYDWQIKLASAKTDEERKQFNKELKRLEGIRSKNKTKNRMNRIIRGINKTSQKIGSITRGVGKFADELGQMGGKPTGRSSGKSSGRKSGKSVDFENFFVDKPSSSGKGVDWDNFFNDKPANRKQTKPKTTKTKKTKRKKKKSKKKKTAKPVTQPQPKPRGMFDGF